MLGTRFPSARCRPVWRRPPASGAGKENECRDLTELRSGGSVSLPGMQHERCRERYTMATTYNRGGGGRSRGGGARRGGNNNRRPPQHTQPRPAAPVVPTTVELPAALTVKDL